MGVQAFLASAKGVMDLIANIYQLQGDQIDIPFANEAMIAWSHIVCPSSSLPDNSSMQRQWDDPVCKAVFSGLLDSASGSDIARLKAATEYEAGAWLNAFPCPNLGTILDGGTLRVAVALRLGCDVCEPHVCKCGKPVDSRAYHGLSCGLWQKCG